MGNAMSFGTLITYGRLTQLGGELWFWVGPLFSVWSFIVNRGSSQKYEPEHSHAAVLLMQQQKH